MVCAGAASWLDDAIPGRVSHIGSPQARPEPKSLVKGVNSLILATALHQDVMTSDSPTMIERSLHDRTAMANVAKIRVGDNVLQKTVTSPTS